LFNHSDATTIKLSAVIKSSALPLKNNKKPKNNKKTKQNNKTTKQIENSNITKLKKQIRKSKQR
jgi:antitoxin component of RelBE/YafQ-DinJ toxin-antitoxin module